MRNLWHDAELLSIPMHNVQLSTYNYNCGCSEGCFLFCPFSFSPSIWAHVFQCTYIAAISWWCRRPWLLTPAIFPNPVMNKNPCSNFILAVIWLHLKSDHKIEIQAAETSCCELVLRREDPGGSCSVWYHRWTWCPPLAASGRESQSRFVLLRTSWLQGVAATGLGFVMFGGLQTGFLNLTGIGMNTAGGVWYSVAKYRQKSSKPEEWIVWLMERSMDLSGHSTNCQACCRSISWTIIQFGWCQQWLIQDAQQRMSLAENKFQAQWWHKPCWIAIGHLERFILKLIHDWSGWG